MFLWAPLKFSSLSKRQGNISLRGVDLFFKVTKKSQGTLGFGGYGHNHLILILLDWEPISSTNSGKRSTLGFGGYRHTYFNFEPTGSGNSGKRSTFLCCLDKATENSSLRHYFVALAKRQKIASCDFFVLFWHCWNYLMWLSCACDNLQIYANILYFAVFDYLKKVTFVLSYKTLNPVFVEHPLVVWEHFTEITIRLNVKNIPENS